jgi:ribA/ribD-fused uncharacterized protein
MNNFHFFYGGPFSQWYPSNLMIDGVKYNTAEQYMMAMKARHFGDEDAYTRIMNAKYPEQQKAIGRQVKNFNADSWNAVSRDYVYKANLEKFSSDASLKAYILATGEDEIVEASPTDRIWGIGLDEYDPLRLDKSNWRGTNWLGEVLMKVRNDIRSKQ